MSLRVQDPAYADKVRRIFEGAAFIVDLGVRLVDVGPGFCESVLDVAPRHLQQDRFVHAGVGATMGDHTAGGAAGTLVKPEETVLTVEFKINLLRPAIGQRLRARAQVLRHGRTLSVVESEIFARDGEKEQLVAKQMVTLAVVTLGGS
ncbi:Phenylacetic acid degradation protein PaaD, thioesterase [Minicystis rosea]|nr:Phenylacetic acid degradation protein PaaD, thioesterase [Minicystis rosea]